MRSAPSSTGLSYPYARCADGRVVHIDQHDGASAVSCLACQARMIPRADGTKVRRHFAHTAYEEVTCSHDGAQRACAKQLIRESFHNNKESARPYLLLWTCDTCSAINNADLTQLSTDVTIDGEAAPGAPCDLVFTGRRSFAIEVRARETPPPSTMMACERKRVPLFVVRPYWDMMDTLRDCVQTDSSHFLREGSCKRCRSHSRMPVSDARARSTKCSIASVGRRR